MGELFRPSDIQGTIVWLLEIEVHEKVKIKGLNCSLKDMELL